MWRSQAEAEGLTLLESDNKTGYLGVHVDQRAKTKPYKAELRRGGKMVYLGSFAIGVGCLGLQPRHVAWIMPRGVRAGD